jgi:O-acetyl-ADP-ribose deacetylase (regulator of RNase III)
MKFLNGDIFNTEAEVIAHQVNCMGAMNSGIAGQIRSRFPVVFDEYSALVNKIGSNRCLGRCQLIETPKVWIANIFGQFHYGRDKQYTEYPALRHAMQDLKMMMANVNLKTIAFPDMIGCGLAGGDRDIVLVMIQEIFPDAEIWKL